VLNGQVQPGDTVAIVGAGPVGLAAILAARLYSPAAIVAIDPMPSRRDWAGRFGANLAFPLYEAIQAYDTFARAGETNALKVLLTAEG
jgi:Zn-dependent alcohol dehydrogenase